MPNPSIIADTLHRQLEEQKALYNNLRLGKSTREAALRRVREIEEELDLPEAERTPNHNGRPAQPEINPDLIATKIETGLIQTTSNDLDNTTPRVIFELADGWLGQSTLAEVRKAELRGNLIAIPDDSEPTGFYFVTLAQLIEALTTD